MLLLLLPLLLLPDQPRDNHTQLLPCALALAGLHTCTHTHHTTPHPNPSVRVASSFVLRHAVHSVNFVLLTV
jgi:hypothetical protein